MRPYEGRNSCPGQGWSRVKFSLNFFPVAKERHSENEILSAHCAMLASLGEVLSIFKCIKKLMKKFK